MILGQWDGMFGKISVVSHLGKQLLMLNSQQQGACFIEPAGEAGLRPGPVHASTYMNGWLMAGVTNPNASAFMIGLGSGCGAVALLSNFPGIDLTVVEIDPEMVEAATKTFPLLHHYQDAGRLQVVTADAVEYMREAHTRGDRWALGLSDAYTGSNEPVMPPDMLLGLTLVCDDVWFNCIDRPQGDKASGVVFDMMRAGKPILSAFGTVGDDVMQNLILSTQAVDPEALAAFKPYGSLSGANVDTARRGYARMISTPVEIIDVSAAHDKPLPAR